MILPLRLYLNTYPGEPLSSNIQNRKGERFLPFCFADSVSICPVPAPVVPSEQVKDPSIKGLLKCFDPQCDKKLNSNSCDGVVGCYWCVRDKHDAPLNKKYCTNINSCYGGKEGNRCYHY